MSVQRWAALAASLAMSACFTPPEPPSPMAPPSLALPRVMAVRYSLAYPIGQVQTPVVTRVELAEIVRKLRDDSCAVLRVLGFHTRSESPSSVRQRLVQLRAELIALGADAARTVVVARPARESTDPGAASGGRVELEVGPAQGVSSGRSGARCNTEGRAR